jgi:hypothetical protein
MDITAETVTAYHAVRGLQQLYDAYRATSRANMFVLGRLMRGIQDADGVPAEKRTRDYVAAAAQAALSRQSEAIFTLRRDQLRRRRLELLGLEELR